MDVLAELEALFAAMPAADKAKVDELLADELAAVWLPNTGPQTQALESAADLLLYGGAAGGGKTDLLIGTALTRHDRTVLFRATFVAMKGLEQRLFEIVGRSGWNGSDHAMRRPDGRVIEFGSLEAPGSENTWQGRPHDLIGFDEGAQLTAQKVRFVMGWNRSTKPGQRCRVIIASNPPIGADGAWLVVWFAPWLDPMFPEPAAPGELRWCVVAGDAEGSTVWVPGPGYYVVELDPLEARPATVEEIAAAERGDVEALAVMATSRSFIPARLDDNPHLAGTDYRAKLMAMPEPMRSKLLKGDFMAGAEDAENQVIPSAWIEAAQDRWKAQARPTVPMTALGVDVSGGGRDETVAAALYGSWFDELAKKLGVDPKDGAVLGGHLLTIVRDKALVGLDGTGGWAGGVLTHLKANCDLKVEAIGFGDGSLERCRDGLLEFLNKRAELWWRFREALDPIHGADVALPPDRRLKAQLSAPTYKLRTRTGSNVATVQVEQKDEIRKRLGSSTDDADAVIIAWSLRKRGLARSITTPTRKRRSWQG